MSAGCIFCGILEGRLPASIVHRDDVCTCFLDIQPVNPGHLLIVPNTHAELLTELPDEVAARMFIVARRMDAALRASGLCCEGVNLFLADGRAAMQEVPHVHLHVFPRFAGDGFGLKFGPNYTHKPSRDALNNVAAQIAAALST